MSAADDPEAILSAMSGCAYRLGMAFGQAAERTDDWDRRLELFQLFDRCFFSVRVATALKLRLRREAVAQARTAVRETDDLRDRERLSDPPDRDASEVERPDHERLDADREREVERASLPVLLETLKGVAADAAALPGPPPAELLSLRELIAQVTGDPPRPARPRPSTPATGTLRARLAGASTAAILTLPRPTGPPGQTSSPPAKREGRG